MTLPPRSPASLAQEAYQKLLRPRVLENRWIPHTPTDKQAAFLALPVREALYGGAAGGGKSDALLMAALMYVDRPGYSALILRRTYADLALPGAIMDRAHDWLGGTGAHWNDTEKTYEFPSGATLTFGYLQTARDKFRYQGAEFQFIGFDELTQFEDSDYRYLFSRLRRLAEADIPIRMRAASNPGGLGHDWVYQRFFVTGRAFGRIFVPARLQDNPHLDQAEYAQSLAELDPITRQQLLDGLWVVDRSRRPFRREWWHQQNRFNPVDEAMQTRVWDHGRFLSYDTAMKDKNTAAYTACVVGELVTPPNELGCRLLVRHAWRDRLIFPDLSEIMERDIARWNADGKLGAVVIEDRVSGTSATQVLERTLPRRLASLVVPFQPDVSKEERWSYAATWCKLGAVWLPHAHESVNNWRADFEAELYSVPDSEFKDYADSFSQLVDYIHGYLAEGHHARSGVAA